MSHTPGPWHFVGGNQIRSDKHQIARVWMMRDGEGADNARLIAAAPDLLAALQAIVTSLAEHDDEGMIEHTAQMENARSAIAKATGAPT